MCFKHISKHRVMLHRLIWIELNVSTSPCNIIRPLPATTGFRYTLEANYICADLCEIPLHWLVLIPSYDITACIPQFVADKVTNLQTYRPEVQPVSPINALSWVSNSNHFLITFLTLSQEVFLGRTKKSWGGVVRKSMDTCILLLTARDASSEWITMMNKQLNGAKIGSLLIKKKTRLYTCTTQK